MTLTDYMSRKEGGNGLASIKDSVDVSILTTRGSTMETARKQKWEETTV